MAGLRFVYPWAFLFQFRHRSNPYFRDPRLLDRINSAVEFLKKRIHRDGSVDQIYPNEKSVALTAAILTCLSQAYVLLGTGFSSADTCVDLIRRMLQFVETGKETHGFISNHRALHACGLLVGGKILNRGTAINSAEKLLTELLESQKDEYFPEYGGGGPRVRFSPSLLSKSLQASFSST